MILYNNIKGVIYNMSPYHNDSYGPPEGPLDRNSTRQWPGYGPGFGFGPGTGYGPGFGFGPRPGFGPGPGYGPGYRYPGFNRGPGFRPGYGPGLGLGRFWPFLFF